MENKLIVYVDGSYKNGRGGWGFLYYNKSRIEKIDMGFGVCHFANSNQTEIMACIKALENIKAYENYDIIEIRTDYLGLVEVINRVTQYYYICLEQVAVELGKQNASLIIRLVQLIIKSNYCIIFSKASKKDKYNKKVHNLAKYALNNIQIRENDMYIWSESDNKFILSQERQSKDDNQNYMIENKKLKEAISWSEKINLEDEAVELNTNNIILSEEIHLKTKSLNFDGLLYESKNCDYTFKPIVVKRLGEDTYGLVLGYRNYCIARILGIKTIKAFITDLSRQELVKRYFIGF